MDSYDRARPDGSDRPDTNVPYLRRFSVIADERTYVLPEQAWRELTAQVGWDCRHAPSPTSSFVSSVDSAAHAACADAPRHVGRLLAAGTLGRSVSGVAESVRWLENYYAMHDGTPFPEVSLATEIFDWSPHGGAIAGVEENGGRLAWWRCRIEPGACRRDALVWQELSDFLTAGAPVPAPAEVVARLRELVEARPNT